MATDLELGLGLVGVDEVVAKLRQVDQAQDQLAGNTARRFAQTVEEIGEELELREALEQANARIAREQAEQARAVEAAKKKEVEAFEKAADSARMQTDALRGSTRAAVDHGAEQQRAATTAIQFALRIQGTVSAVTALSAALGSRNATTGLVSNVAALTAQSAQLGSMFGPGGALVTGVVGFTFGLAQAIEATRTATDAQGAYRQEIDRSIDSIDAYVQAAQRMAQAQHRTQLIEEGLGSVGEQFATANLAGQEVGRLRFQRQQLRGQMRAAESGGDARGQALGRQLQAQINELDQRIRAAESESNRLGALARQAEADEAAIADDAASLQQDRDVAAGGGGSDPASRRRARRLRRELGMGGGGHGPTPMDENLIAYEERLRAFQQAQRDHDAEMARIREAQGQIEKAGDLEKLDRLEQQIELQREAAREAAEHDREKIESQRELARVAEEAAYRFTHGWMTSIDEVNEAWNDANVALRSAGQGMIGTSSLLERSLVATGNSIATTIGDEMTGAFKGAVTAWVSGAKSFEEAAADMAKGVIQALVIESIVQAVAETARGIADLASYQYATAAQHFAAAAAWGAVGAVAGAVGAGVGAFGGGSGGAQGASQSASNGRDLASRSVSDGDDMRPTLIIIEPGWASARERQEFFYDGIRDGARRGMRVEPRALRGVGGRR